MKKPTDDNSSSDKNKKKDKSVRKEATGKSNPHLPSSSNTKKTNIPVVSDSVNDPSSSKNPRFKNITSFHGIAPPSPSPASSSASSSWATSNANNLYRSLHYSFPPATAGCRSSAWGTRGGLEHHGFLPPGIMLGSLGGLVQRQPNVALTPISFPMPSENQNRVDQKVEKGKRSSRKRAPPVEEEDPNELPVPCHYCHRRFRSMKSYFGHLRSHPEREFRGAYPPPVGAIDINIYGNAAPEVAIRRRFDLNVAPSEQEGEGVDGPPAGRRRSNRLRFDLNKLPPPENDDC